MGNSNLQPTSSLSNLEKDLSVRTLEVYYESSVYGKYTLPQHSTESIIKLYVAHSNLQKSQLKQLIQAYRRVNHPSLIPLHNYQENEDNEKTQFRLQFERYESTLKQDIQNRNGGYSEKEIVSMIKLIVEVLIEMRKTDIPFGLLTPAKIAVKNEPEKRSFLTSDHLMNPQLYQHGFDFKDPMFLPYLSPQEIQLINKNHQSEALLNRSEQAIIFSIGIILLEMIFRELVNRNQIKHYLFQMRREYSYQLSEIIGGMLNNEKRHSLDSLILELKSYEANLDKGSIRIGYYPIKRGYNCLQSLFFLDQQAILPASKAKLLKKNEATS